MTVRLNQRLRVLLALCAAFMALACITSPALAAKPAVAHLLPAGGQRGTTVKVKIADNPLKPVPNLWCNDSDLKLTVGKDAKSIDVQIPENAIPGVRWIRFFNDEGTSAAIPFVVGLMKEISEEEPNNRVRSAQAVDLPLIINGTLHARNENDSFKVSLKEGQTLVAAMDANYSVGSPMDAVLQLVSPTGFVLAQNDDDRNFDPRLVYTAKKDGEYIVRTFAFPAVPNSTIGYAGAKNFVYRLTLTTGKYIDHLLPPVVAASGIDGQKPIGWNLSASPAETLEVVDGPDKLTSFDKDSANAINVDSTKFPIVEQPATSAGDDAVRFQLPSTLCGTIEPGSLHRFVFAGKKGQLVTATAKARLLGSKLDPVLQLVSSDGKVLEEVDDSTRNVADCKLSEKLKSDGDYEIRIKDRFDHGGMRYYYAIEVTQTVSEFSLAASADAFTVSKGKPLKIPVTITRTSFNEKIELSVEGLPGKVVCKPVVSESKGKTAKAVELQIDSRLDKPWSGPIRIKATSKNTSFTPAKTSGGRTLYDFWLTIAK